MSLLVIVQVQQNAKHVPALRQLAERHGLKCGFRGKEAWEHNYYYRSKDEITARVFEVECLALGLHTTVWKYPDDPPLTETELS